jgi:hypothetical protein
LTAGFQRKQFFRGTLLDVGEHTVYMKYYKIYVDDVFIIYNTSRINERTIQGNMNNIDEHVEFKSLRR